MKGFSIEHASVTLKRIMNAMDAASFEPSGKGALLYDKDGNQIARIGADYLKPEEGAE